jgi:hypothetical protein
VAAFAWNRWQLCRGISGSFAVESVAALAWNQWQLYRGTGGSLRVESVAALPWNRWQLSRGIRNLRQKRANRNPDGSLQRPEVYLDETFVNKNHS